AGEDCHERLEMRLLDDEFERVGARPVVLAIEQLFELLGIHGTPPHGSGGMPDGMGGILYYEMLRTRQPAAAPVPPIDQGASAPEGEHRDQTAEKLGVPGGERLPRVGEDPG